MSEDIRLLAVRVAILVINVDHREAGGTYSKMG